MTDAPASTLERVPYRKGAKEVPTVVLTADNMSIRVANDGTLVVELFRYGSKEEPIEGYQMRFSLEDRRRLRDYA